MNTPDQQVNVDAAQIYQARLQLNKADVTLRAGIPTALYTKMQPSLASVSGILVAAQQAARAWVTANPPTPTPATPPPAPADVTSEPKGSFSFPAVPYIVGGNADPTVGQNVWSGEVPPQYSQTLSATSPAEWSVNAKADSNFGGVIAFPNTGLSMPENTIDSSEAITSTWDVTMPTDDTKTAAWAAYDLWFNDWKNEVMIQVDITANSDYAIALSDPRFLATVSFNGMQWHLVGPFGTEYVWKPGANDQTLLNQVKGTIDIKAMLTWMEVNGYLPKGSTWTAASFGFEICDTQGNAQTFRVNDFTFKA